MDDVSNRGPAPAEDECDLAPGKPAPAAQPGLIDGLRLHDTPGHLLRRAQQRAVELFMQAVGDDGLRPPQFALLLAAYQNPGANQSDLVRETGIDRSTAADMITRLAAKGLIRRTRTKTDARANRLTVTAAGIAALENAAAAAIAAQEQIMAPIAAGRRDRFLSDLRRITDLDQNRTSRQT